MSGFPTQQQAQARTASLASTRLSNGKLGGGANWSFNLPVSGSSGLPGSQQRTMGTMGSFAQSLGGSQSAAPLDLSEFPSLSGASQQSQSQTPGQLMWANASQRAAQQTPVQRQQLPPTSQTPSRSSQPQGLPTPQQSQPQHDDMFPSGSQFANRLDDFRNGGQGISSQLGAGGQPQTGNIEEFPPLGRNAAAELPLGRTGSLMQGAGFGGYGTGLGAPRSPVSQVPNGILGQEKADLNNGVLPSQRNFSDPQQLQQRQPENIDGQDVSNAAQNTEQPPLAQMSELDRFGLAGLLRMIHSESPDVASLAVGQDLMTLGLDLNQAEPLHTSFASPFVSSMSAVPLEQDFSLPGCYNVANIQPLQSRIPGFSDETLFFIFYSMPRDIMQELVAEELMGRKWRYHKLERCWLTRDETYPGPVDVERGVTERGVYLLWDSSAWKKVRREFILRYEDLDNRLDPNRGAARPPGVVHHAS
ncbi:hypothetical protein DTO013E5_2021 [Penicillium roqueforti]|nr:uncharacterized protein LCP9604111_1457 [Penicillium roqueforti]KAF9253931.1 hypothetical protein LCP9604111_1457 [Penicillium roqueforti]KAI1835551.1 hypothetical protein CBS147337_3574 [Penicillium roqueforti]KAI2675597.1 hypothetical protein CBS147355_6591 [Penicillium roqueforti]KAI2687212.1 hypothetical protein LCP963914a_3813 [Penicillium roqueforti]KAI2698556.1 hypothetical protein CBS147372_7086 [Penicillium roqueforti]